MSIEHPINPEAFGAAVTLYAEQNGISWADAFPIVIDLFKEEAKK